MKTPEEIKYGLASHGYEICDKRCAYHDWRGTGHDCSSMLCQDAHTYIEKLESQIPRWIPVEERLPERHGQQCVGLYSIGEYKGYLTPYIFTWHAYGNNGYVDGPHFNDEGLDGLKVHYWMPMPEPPKKEDKK